MRVEKILYGIVIMVGLIIIFIEIYSVWSFPEEGLLIPLILGLCGVGLIYYSSNELEKLRKEDSAIEEKEKNENE